MIDAKLFLFSVTVSAIILILCSRPLAKNNSLITLIVVYVAFSTYATTVGIVFWILGFIVWG